MGAKCERSPLVKIRIPNFPQKSPSFSKVYPVAKGVVKEIVADRPDILKTNINAPADCGNKVVIKHKNNWESSYCHLRKDSSREIAVGQKVSTETVLGDIGISGNTTYPHLAFPLMKDGQAYDMNQGVPISEASCPLKKKPLWDKKTTKKLKDAYAPQVISMGVSTHEPEIPSLILSKTSLSDNNPEEIYVYALLGNSSPTDQAMIVLEDDEGNTLARNITQPFGGGKVA